MAELVVEKLTDDNGLELSLRDAGALHPDDISSIFDSEGTAPLNGVAVASAISTKQDTLTFDTVPTTGSTNPVTSDGVKNALTTLNLANPDWDETDITAHSYIDNKPIPLSTAEIESLFT